MHIKGTPATPRCAVPGISGVLGTLWPDVSCLLAFSFLRLSCFPQTCVPRPTSISSNLLRWVRTAIILLMCLSGYVFEY